MSEGHAPDNATLWVVSAALFIDALVYGIIIPFLPLYSKSLGISESQTGFLFAIYALTLVFGAAVLPWLSQRWGMRRLILAGFVIMLVSTLVFATGRSYGVLLAARAVQGLAGASTWSLGPAMLAQVYAEQRGRVMGIAITGSAVGTIIGPPVGGLLFDWGGFMAPFVAVAIAPLLLLLYAWRSLPEVRFQGDVLLFRLARQRSVLVVALTVAMAATLMSFLEPVLPLHLHQVFAAGATENGLVFGACVLAYGIVSPITGALSDRLGRNLVSGVGLLGCAVVLPFLGLVPSLLWVGAVMAVFGALLALALAPTLAAMADVVSGLGSDFASGYVITNTAYAGGMMLGPLAGGALMQGWGFNAALWAAALLSLLIGLTLLSSRRR